MDTPRVRWIAIRLACHAPDSGTLIIDLPDDGWYLTGALPYVQESPFRYRIAASGPLNCYIASRQQLGGVTGYCAQATILTTVRGWFDTRSLAAQIAVTAGGHRYPLHVYPLDLAAAGRMVVQIGALLKHQQWAALYDLWTPEERGLMPKNSFIGDMNVAWGALGERQTTGFALAGAPLIYNGWTYGNDDVQPVRIAATLHGQTERYGGEVQLEWHNNRWFVEGIPTDWGNLLPVSRALDLHDSAHEVPTATGASS
jgi:hypothetical protein